MRKDREPDEDDAAFALARFVPLLQEVVEDAGGLGCLQAQGRVHGWMCVCRAAGLAAGLVLQAVAGGGKSDTLTIKPASCALLPAAAGKLSTDEYPFVATPASPSSARSGPSSADTTPKVGDWLIH